MRRAVKYVPLAILLSIVAGVVANAVSTATSYQEWTDNQSGAGQFQLFNVTDVSVNNLEAGGPVYSETTGHLINGRASYATWTGVAFYAVDGVAGNDANTCFSTVSQAAAGAVACKTIAGVMSKIPMNGNFQGARVAVKAGTYAEPLNLSGFFNYSSLIVAGTGTNSTAGAVAFADDANDDIYLGAVTATGMNAAGYNPTGTPTTTTFTTQLAGGGASSFPAEPARPLGVRMRFDSATATTTLRNAAEMVIEVDGSTQLSPADTLAVAPSTSDVVYLEEPGVSVQAITIGSRNVEVAGFSGTKLTIVAAAQGITTLAFVEISGNVNIYDGAGLFFQPTYINNAHTVILPVGFGLLAYGANFIARDANGLSITNSSSLSTSASIGFEILDCQSFQMQRFVSTKGVSLLGSPSWNATFQNLWNIGTNTSTAHGHASRIIGPATIVTGVTFNAGLIIGADVGVEQIVFSNMGTAPAIQIAGTGYSVNLVAPTGSVGNTGVGVAMPGALEPAKFSNVTILPAATVTGSAGDIALADGTIVTWAQAAAGLFDSGGNRFLGENTTFPIRVLPAGTTLSGGTVTIPELGGGGDRCVHTNDGGTLSGAACGGSSDAGAPVTVVGVAPIRVDAGSVSLVGGYVSGSTSTTAQNLGTQASGYVKDDKDGGVAQLYTVATIPATDVTGLPDASTTRYFGEAPIRIDAGAVGITGAIVSGSASTSATQNLGAAGAGGVLQDTKDGGVAYVAPYSTVASEVQFGATSGGGLAQSGNFLYDTTNSLRLAGADGIGTAINLNSTTPFGGLQAIRKSGSGDFYIGTAIATALHLAAANNDRIILEPNNDIAIGTGLNTTSTSGFLFMPSAPGAPTGTPSATYSGGASLATYLDSTNNRWDVYNGGVWRLFAQDDGVLSGAPGLLKTDAVGIHTIATPGTDYVTPGTIVTCGQLPAFTGDVGKPLASCATTVNAVPCGALPAFTGAVTSTGGTCATTVNFTGLTGSATCVQLPALTGDTHTSAGTCGTVTDHLSFSGGSLPLGACSTNGEAVIRDGTGALSCVLPSTDLTNDWTAPWVVGVHETSGPTQLLIGAIPASTPDATVLVRPAGSATIVGIDSNSLSVADKLAYFINITLGVSGGWIATSSSSSVLGTTAVEYTTTHIVKAVTLCANLIANGIVSGSPLLVVTRNGSGIGGGAAIGLTSTTAPGVYCTSGVATGSTSATDTYGVQESNSATGTLTLTATLVLN